MHVTASTGHSSMQTHGHSDGPPVEMTFGPSVGAVVASGVLLRDAPSAASRITAIMMPTTATPAKINNIRVGIPPTPLIGDLRGAGFLMVASGWAMFHCA